MPQGRDDGLIRAEGKVPGLRGIFGGRGLRKKPNLSARVKNSPQRQRRGGKKRPSP